MVESPRPPDPDAELVGRAQAGSYEAFEELVSRHERRVYAIAMSITRHRNDAEDVVQTTFLNALEHLADFRNEASFAAWIGRIAGNAALKLLRKRRGLRTVSLDRPRLGREDGEIRHPEYIADWRGDPVDLLGRQELKRALDQAIDKLPENHRLVFVLRDIAALNVEQTAAALGISKANVKVRLLRARLALRERLTRLFGDESKRVVRTHRHEGDDREATPAAELLESYREEDDS